MVKKPEKVGGQKVATEGLCRGPGGEDKGCGAEPPATENFCIFYPKKVILVLCTMHYTNTKCSDM